MAEYSVLRSIRVRYRFQSLSLGRKKLFIQSLSLGQKKLLVAYELEYSSLLYEYSRSLM
jgi:hypothetical protein